MPDLTAVHDDGTDCDHHGPPRMATPHGPAVCHAGLRVTHLRVDGHEVTVGQAVTAVQEFGRALTAALTPAVTALAAFAKALSGDPALQAAAAAAGVIHAARTAATPPPEGDVTPAGDIDPCGNGPITRDGQLPGQLTLPLGHPPPFPAIECDAHGPMDRDDLAGWHRCGQCGRTLTDEECLRLIRAAPGTPQITVT